MQREFAGIGAKPHAANILSAPENKPWKLREFTVAGPDANLLRVIYDFA